MYWDRNCLSKWWPCLRDAGIPTPRTEIVRTDINLSLLLDGDTPDGFVEFLAELEAARQRIGGDAVFLRTGQGSGKHQWKTTCFLPAKADLAQHVHNLVEWSESVDLLGLPTNVWVVREMLPVEPIAVLDAYGSFPLVPELRCFVQGGKVVCTHSYWPAKAICAGFHKEPGNIGNIIFSCGWRAENSEVAERVHLARRVAEVFACHGVWSVDLLLTRRGWVCIDMADAALSFHWQGCANEKRWS